MDFEIIGFVARSLLCAVFALAAAGKAFDLDEFRDTLALIGVPRSVQGPLSVSLIITEAGLALLFLLGVAPVLAVVVSAGLLASFAVVSVRSARSERDIPCRTRT